MKMMNFFREEVHLFIKSVLKIFVSNQLTTDAIFVFHFISQNVTANHYRSECLEAL